MQDGRGVASRQALVGLRHLSRASLRQTRLTSDRAGEVCDALS
jgi:hypothetical protein